MPDYGPPARGLLVTGQDPLSAAPPKSISGETKPLVTWASGDANRVARIINPVVGDWVIRRVTISNDVAGSIAKLYIGEPAGMNLVSVDKFGDGDELDLINPYYVPQGTPFCVQWSDGTPNECFVRVEFETVS